MFTRYILTEHPDYKGDLKVWYRNDDLFSIEGGDILNLSARAVAVGISQRTMPEAIETLAERLFYTEGSEVETVLAVDIPSLRAYMHLDTVLTQVDTDKFIVYPGILQDLHIYKITRGSGGSRIHVEELLNDLARALAGTLGLPEVTLIHCGGTSRVAAEREQWNDGSNTLAVAPGKVIVYDRNNTSNHLLRAHGIQTLEIPSSELSRGRGGPRCMSCPLLRA